MPNHKIVAIDNLSLQELDSEAELIPLMTPEDEEEMNNEELPADLPILPLRNTVLFPGVVIPITAGRDKSIKLINDANAAGKIIGVVAQKNEEDEDPTKDDIHTVGTVARILRVLKMPDGNITIILQGKKRFEIEEVVSEEPYITATVKEVPEKRPKKNDTEFNAIIDSLKELAFSKMSKDFSGLKNYGYGFRLKQHKLYGKIVYHTGWWKGFRSYFIKVLEKDQTIIVLNNVKRGRFLNIDDLIDLIN